MTSESRLAFEHPEARSEASGQPAAPPDRISLRDHVVEAEIGAFQQERGTTQRLRFNIVVEVRAPDGPVEDDVDKILSYDTISEAIAFELAAERLNLLETLAERVADRILFEPQTLRVFVRIEKLDRGPGALGVEIVRSHGQSAPVAPSGEELPHPIVVHLSNEAVAAPALIALLDRLEAGSAPAILCVGPPDMPVPDAKRDLPQRRIDLLAIELNAWVLAARDRRCVVVGTRTELDWAMKHNQICVWAPSKIVLDAVDGDEADVTDPLALTAWFAGLMQAEEILCVGCPVPETDLPTRTIVIGETP
ncbi:dihydroneopterin aldolase [Maritimibacter sp. UBA3975]|uniref:dihydroneopterin aldolase n=1 Tax=Maritimibacter sp. UBA3975 TaxID=1946833 RepID=UPI000C0AF8DD|nr:dihydroneopterin aldolase [Maritimibacter sp. UBA3975]MAM62544.1 diguanylate cyclase [Maritimibacter sp.]|tara:strand:- start:10194 stop:11114 length:921 start_codon:yes stop_codon:yes gene_type:complete